MTYAVCSFPIRVLKASWRVHASIQSLILAALWLKPEAASLTVNHLMNVFSNILQFVTRASGVPAPT